MLVTDRIACVVRTTVSVSVSGVKATNVVLVYIVQFDVVESIRRKNTAHGLPLIHHRSRGNVSCHHVVTRRIREEVLSLLT